VAWRAALGVLYSRYYWCVTNVRTHEQTAAGDASGEDQAMADAPGAAGIREIITWRGIGLIVSERG